MRLPSIISRSLAPSLSIIATLISAIVLISGGGVEAQVLSCAFTQLPSFVPCLEYGTTVPIPQALISITGALRGGAPPKIMWVVYNEADQPHTCVYVSCKVGTRAVTFQNIVGENPGGRFFSCKPNTTLSQYPICVISWQESGYSLPIAVNQALKIQYRDQGVDKVDNVVGVVRQDLNIDFINEIQSYLFYKNAALRCTDTPRVVMSPYLVKAARCRIATVSTRPFPIAPTFMSTSSGVLSDASEQGLTFVSKRMFAVSSYGLMDLMLNGFQLDAIKLNASSGTCGDIHFGCAAELSIYQTSRYLGCWLAADLQNAWNQIYDKDCWVPVSDGAVPVVQMGNRALVPLTWNYMQ